MMTKDAAKAGLEGFNEAVEALEQGDTSKAMLALSIVLSVPRKDALMACFRGGLCALAEREIENGSESTSDESTSGAQGKIVCEYDDKELFAVLVAEGVCDGAAYGAWPDHKCASAYNENAAKKYGPGYYYSHGSLYHFPAWMTNRPGTKKYVLIKVIK
jgi:hypothetical protein